MGYSYVFNPLSGAFDTVQNLQTVRAPDNAFLPPTGATVFSDTFTESSTVLLDAHTPDVGTGWSLAYSTGGATFSVYNTNTLRPTVARSNLGCLYLADNTAPAAAVEVSIRLTAITSGANVVGLVFRYVDSDNFYLLTMSSTISNCILWKKVSGVWTSLGATNTAAAAGRTWKVRAVDTNIVVYADDVIIKITSDSGVTGAGLCGISAGTIGQNATDDVSTSWQLDDFQVVNYASAGGTVTDAIYATGDIEATGQILGNNTSSTVYPAFAFANDTDTGFAAGAANNLQIITGGVRSVLVNSSGVNVSARLFIGNGTNSSPAYTFTGDTNTGLYWVTADTIGITTAGVQRWTVNNGGRLATPLASINPNTTDIATHNLVSNSGGSAAGFNVFNTNDYVNTYFRADDFSNGGSLIGDGSLFFNSGYDYGHPYAASIDFYLAATNSDSLIGDFNVYFGGCYGGNGGNINLYAGASTTLGDGGAVNIYGGNSDDQVGGAVTISGGNGPTAYGAVVIQPDATAPIAVFGTGGSAQLDTTVTGATFTASTGTTVNNNSTFDGYTIGQIVAALRTYGWLA